MKIAVVAPEFPPETGGTQRYADGLVNALVKTGHEVTVFIRHDSAYQNSSDSLRIKKVLSVNFKKDRKALLPYRGEFDLWHVCNASYSWIGLFVPVVLTVFGNDIIAPYLFMSHFDLKKVPVFKKGDRISFELNKRYTERLQRKGFKKVRKIISISQVTKERAVLKYPFVKHKTEVIPVGIEDFSYDKPVERDEKVTHILSVCRLDEPRKNVDSVIRALAGLKNKNFEYTIVGEGQQKAVLEKLCSDLGMGNQVVFEGRVSPERLVELYSGADLFILTPTIEKNSIEGFGIVYLEANSYGVPVLATRAAGCLDAVAENISGYFVDEPAPGNILKQINRFLETEIRFDRDKVAGHAESFTWDKVVLKILELYKKIM